ncbi:aminopeptidase [Ignisphaera sp. 4213-co]|uniref:Aminopeptidase n=1 Tax=Ignisphaera cupida TaxID=3050454 RepID=A0ABD4Z9F2_9CREN|nr:aminopeptidase [Ignisphaera sp. 4213-co]MDK6028718.1 aminopeptidase [Ignisphaera sp. 4213-co]
MRDVDKYAKLIVDYCVSVRKLDEVAIYSSLEAMPLVREIWREVVIRGAYPRLVINDDYLTEIFYRYAPRELLDYVSPVDRVIAEKITVRISILSPQHSKPLIGVDPEKVKLRYQAVRELREIFIKRDASGDLRWVVAPYPTYAMAQEAGMSPMDFEEFVYRAVKLYESNPVEAWIRQSKWQEKIANMLSKVDELRIVSENTDLLLKVGGRIWINDDGKNNMPGGEVFSAPHEDSVEGFIAFEYPAIYSGVEVEGVRLVFKKGEVVEAYATKGLEFLKKMLEIDEGAKRVGEIAFGLNYDITRFTKEILFDEKIGGTIHMALGSAYLKTGGKNMSSLHWDMVKDMRKGKVYADKDLIYENGRFIKDFV